MNNKFRAWNDTEKAWVTGLFGLLMRGKDVNKASNKGKIPCYIEICSNSDVKLTQFTGIYDKNGKEIFENDIVLVTNIEGKIDRLDSNTGAGIVEWLNEWGFWNVDKIENSLGDLKNEYYIEIIGNIYENPKKKRKKCVTV